MEEIEIYLDSAEETMDGAIKHLIIELGKIRAGRASPQMLDGIQVDYYGSLRRCKTWPRSIRRIPVRWQFAPLRSV